MCMSEQRRFPSLGRKQGHVSSSCLKAERGKEIGHPQMKTHKASVLLSCALIHVGWSSVAVMHSDSCNHRLPKPPTVTPRGGNQVHGPMAATRSHERSQWAKVKRTVLVQWDVLWKQNGNQHQCQAELTSYHNTVDGEKLTETSYTLVTFWQHTWNTSFSCVQPNALQTSPCCFSTFYFYSYQSGAAVIRETKLFSGW